MLKNTKNKNSMLAFLEELEQNNNREWFHSHKAERLEANAQFEELIKSLMLRLGESTPAILQFAPKELTFKLTRDTRFSHDKSPYNPAFRCHISSAGKLPVPVGYYLQVKPGDRSFLGGGLFADMFKDATARIRDSLNLHGEEFKEIITNEEFARCFEMKGTALKNVPKEYDPQHPLAEYLKYKCLYIEDTFEDALLDDMPSFVDYAAERFLLMKPFNDYLNKALKGFRLPVR